MNLIISHNNERTLKVTAHRSKQLGFIVHLVNDGLFYRTYKKSLELASYFKDEWFVFMAGDQYLLDTAKQDIENRIKNTVFNVWAVSGYGFDYLWQTCRMMVPIIYRTRYVGDALCFADRLTSSTIRPEGTVIKQMINKGYSHTIDKTLKLANHDFDQYYKDIYRKGFFQARKCKNQKNLNKFKKSISRIKNKDMDHVIFFQGINDFINKSSTDIFTKYNLEEKDPL